MLAGLKIQAEVYVPLMLHGLFAGFPSPADDYIDESIDLTRLSIRNPPASLLWKVDSRSMRDAGIFHGDLIVLDRSVTGVDGDIVVATVHGERSLKRMRMNGNRTAICRYSTCPRSRKSRSGAPPCATSTGSDQGSGHDFLCADRWKFVLLFMRACF